MNYLEPIGVPHQPEKGIPVGPLSHLHCSVARARGSPAFLI